MCALCEHTQWECQCQCKIWRSVHDLKTYGGIAPLKVARLHIKHNNDIIFRLKSLKFVCESKLRRTIQVIPTNTHKQRKITLSTYSHSIFFHSLFRHSSVAHSAVHKLAGAKFGCKTSDEDPQIAIGHVILFIRACQLHTLLLRF